MKEQKPSHLNRSLDRGLQILDLFSRDIAALSVKEIADQIGVGTTTIYPFIHTLVSHGYLETDTDKRYRLGLKLFERVGEINQVYDVRSVARRELTKLSRQVAANARLAVLYGNEVLYLDQQEGGPAANIVLREVVGLRVPCYCTALGKVLLAYLPPEDLDRIINSLVLNRLTDFTITCPNELRQELERTRKRGYSTEIEELQLGGACVGAPIRNSTGKVVAAISTSVLASRARGKELETIASAVVKTAADISAQLGLNAQDSL